MHYLIDENAPNHDLKSLAWIYTSIGGYDDALKIDIGSLKDHDYRDSSEGDEDGWWRYNAGDADATIRVHNELAKSMTKELWENLHDIKMPAGAMLARIEASGLFISPDELARQDTEFKSVMDECYNNIRATGTCQEYEAETGSELNFKSPKQMREFLYESKWLGIEPHPDHMTKTGPSTSMDAIEAIEKRGDKLSGDAKIVFDNLVRFRQASAVHSQVIAKIPAMVNRSQYKLLHPNFVQHFVVTGRLSSRNPNMQNFQRGSSAIEAGIPPVRRLIQSRQHLYGRSGGVIMQADFKAHELRVLASLSGDKELISMFQQDRDPHAATASVVFGIPYENFEKDPKKYKEYRQKGKTLNFGVVFMEGPTKIAKDLNIPVDEAKRLVDTMYRKMPGMRKWILGTADFVTENGYSVSMFGQRRRVAGAFSNDDAVASAARREATNHVIQSTASDLCLVFAMDMEKRLYRRNHEIDPIHLPHSNLILLVHDSVVFDVEMEEVEFVYEQINESIAWMNRTIKWIKAQLAVDIEIGDNWNDLEKV